MEDDRPAGSAPPAAKDKLTVAQRPTEADMDPALRAAWAYFVEEMSQAEVAEQLGVSRASVHNYIALARRKGLVQVVIDPHLIARSNLATRLADRFGLERLFVVPPGRLAPLEAVSTAASMWLEHIVAHDASLGVAWGETIGEVAARMPTRRFGEMTVVQLVGSLASPRSTTAEACTTLIADRSGARYRNLYAPAVLSRADLARSLAQEPVIADHFAALERLDAALFAVGLPTRTSHIAETGLASAAEIEDYASRGARGVVAGRFIGGDGEPMAGPLDGRVMGISLETLRAVTTKVVVSAGADRAEAVRAALKGGFVTHLITDHETANLLDKE